MLYTKNRLVSVFTKLTAFDFHVHYLFFKFAKFGHDCEITHTVAELPMFKSSRKLSTRVKRWFIRMRMASEVNLRGNSLLKSQGALAREHYRHLKYLYMIHPFSDVRYRFFKFLINF